MRITTVTQYIGSISSPAGLFRTLGEPVCERDARGWPVFVAGGNAVVFPVFIDGKRHALKCYTSPRPYAAAACRYFSHRPSPLLAAPRYLPDEIYVYDTPATGHRCDAVVTEWTDGFTLDFELRRALHRHDADTLRRLAAAFVDMAEILLREPWAHGDLKPSNIIVAPEGGMVLTDMDAAFWPGCPTDRIRESGTPSYNHPRRNDYPPGKHADDYPIALLSATLRALAEDISLAGLCDSEMQLLHPTDIFSGNRKRYDEVRRSAARRGDLPLLALLDMLSSPSPMLPDLPAVLAYIGRFDGAAAPEHPCDTVPTAFRNEAGKWGYRCGDTVAVPPVLDNALEFTESLAAVNAAGYNHFIHTDGRHAIDCSRYERIKPFRNGYAEVRIGGEWLRIDHSGAPADDSAAQPDGCP